MSVSLEKKVKFAAQANPEVLAALRDMASQEGRHLQALIDEALRNYVTQKQGQTPGRRVLDALNDSVAQYDSLYRELSK